MDIDLKELILSWKKQVISRSFEQFKQKESVQDAWEHKAGKPKLI